MTFTIKIQSNILNIKIKIMANTPKIVSTDLVGMVTVKHKTQTCCYLVCVDSSSVKHKKMIFCI